MTKFDCVKQRRGVMISSSFITVLMLFGVIMKDVDGFGSSNNNFGTKLPVWKAVKFHSHSGTNSQRKISSRRTNHPVFHNNYKKCNRDSSTLAVVADPNVSMNLLNSIRTVISSLSMSPSIVSDVIVSTPPVAYFLALIAAGFGVPISEDAMCILVGASWNALQEQQKRNAVILSLYAGIVLSDYLTFIIGRTLRRGVLEPIRKKVLGNDADSSSAILSTSSSSSGNDTMVSEGGKKTRRRKRDRVLAKISQAGDYVGFITRLSVGMRGPMILFTGFSGTTTFTKFALGALLGALVSLPIQLLIGYRMNLAATAGNTVFNVNTVATVGLVVSLSTIGLSSLPFITKLCKLIISKISTLLRINDNKTNNDTADTTSLS